MKKYVVGFMFSEDRQFVALIRKNRPEWQAGKLNGIGGKIEQGETPVESMIREFREETGVETTRENWPWAIGSMQGLESRIFVFSSFSDKVFEVKTTTDELVRIFCVDGFPYESAVPNLRAIIPALLLPDLKSFHLDYFL